MVGQDSYIVSSNDNTEDIDEDDIFKYIDDVNILEIVLMANLLQEYQYLEHVPNDIGTNDMFLPPGAYKMQRNLDSVSEWTRQNLMKLNTKKSNYILFTRTHTTNFQTRLSMAGEKIDRKYFV